MPDFTITLQEAIDSGAVVELQLGAFIQGNQGLQGPPGPTGDVTPEAEAARDDAQAAAADAAASAADAAATLSSALLKASNLSDLTDAAAARGNLALGSMATQQASNVAISGGSINATPVGAGGASSGAFTTLSSSGAATLNSLGLTTALPVASGGTGSGVAATALSNLGGAPLASPAFTGTPTAPTASAATNTTQIATTAHVNSKLAAPPAIGGTTPNTGAFTTLSATGAITPSQTAGIVGTTTNNNANAGSVGEYASSSVAGPGTGLSSGAAANVTSLSLTAGDWDVTGSVAINSSSANVTGIRGWTSTTSATPPAQPNNGGEAFLSTSTGSFGAGTIIPVGEQRFSLSATTTVYLSMYAVFPSGTVSGYGFLRARRVR